VRTPEHQTIYRHCIKNIRYEDVAVTDLFFRLWWLKQLVGGYWN